MEKQAFCTFMAEVVRRLPEEGHAPAAHVHRYALRSFGLFLKGREVLFDHMTPSLLKEYEAFLLRMGRSLNTVSTYLRALRSTLNRAVECGLATPQSGLFRRVYTGVCAPTKRALPPDEVEQLLTAEAPPALKYAQVWFSLMFLLRGMPFIDLAHLRKSDFHGRTITYRRHKTGKELHVILPSEALALMERYADSSDSAYLFPILREDGDGYASALRTLNAQLYRLSQHLHLPSRISSYTPRHSWATIAYHQDVAIGAISGVLGHTSIRTTESYLAPMGNEKLNEAHKRVLQAVFRNREERVND